MNKTSYNVKSICVDDIGNCIGFVALLPAVVAPNAILFGFNIVYAPYEEPSL